jgi:glyceraldehyde-3-phosphate dehydrogenase (ferredoxin)
MDHTLALFGADYADDPRILSVGPAAQTTDFGAIASAPVVKGKVTHVDTWAGRGGLGSKLLQDHGIAAVAYGGTYLDEDFRDRKVADRWFEEKYSKNLAAKDFEATTKYRFDPKFDTGGTFGVNFSSLGGRLIAFNYRSIYMDEAERLDIHRRFVLDHYLKQFNEETIQPKKQKTCGEPCAAVCKKMFAEFKKDYEPYQTMGPLCGIFDQRAAELLNHRADIYGFDAISVGGVLAWLMESLAENHVTEKELGVSSRPIFSCDGFSIETDSMHNARLGVELLDAIVGKRGPLDLERGARRLARHLARQKGADVLNAFVYNAFGRGGWMVPNQYWVPGVISPMAIMGKYYMYYGTNFYPPRELGRKNAERFLTELALDNLGICRFHREWASDLLPDILQHLYGLQSEYTRKIAMTAARINSRNSSVFWESERNFDYVYSFLKRRKEVEGDTDAELAKWIDFFEKDRKEAALSFWYEVHKGIHESLREF